MGQNATAWNLLTSPLARWGSYDMPQKCYTSQPSGLQIFSSWISPNRSIWSMKWINVAQIEPAADMIMVKLYFSLVCPRSSPHIPLLNGSLLITPFQKRHVIISTPRLWTLFVYNQNTPILLMWNTVPRICTETLLRTANHNGRAADTPLYDLRHFRQRDQYRQQHVSDSHVEPHSPVLCEDLNLAKTLQRTPQF